MLRNLAELGIAFVDLVAVQAREIGNEAKAVGVRLALLGAFGVLAAGMLLGGTGLLVWALYQVLAREVTSAAAAALTGAAVWIVIGVAAWIAISAVKRPASKSR
ncbi:MAG TPA: hypothetical protein VKZ43_09760 [Trueperaceae bacterium]|nr:hypothetical protein [Trueperaceae bacterium]